MREAGTHLDESVRLNTLMERALLNAFPDEIEHIWTRTGAPEVATDPGGVESSDTFVMLTPRSQWRKAKTQAELVTLMDQEMSQIPGQTYWFTQPIEQRINEMISGARADLAIKLFCDDFDAMLAKSEEIADVVRRVPGAADVAVEQISGQPILQIRIDQDAIARYGVPAATVLDIVESIGGKSVGEIVEGKLRFPLAIRLPDDFRSQPEAIDAILVPSAAGELIPLSRLTDSKVVAGPRMIPREAGRRRVTIQCNVRGRDVGSFVADAQAALAKAVDLPPDKFRLEWGGQFENLQRAKGRLAIVVPLALGLVIVLLYVTYKSARDALVVFTCVPFACVGGILMLVAREMPFSVSAAVGFITLSGVSVLNAMVLISAVRDLVAEGRPLTDAIREACRTRLRTVMMTALVASVGFLPMAVSTGVGAEVQRPLATVVIGGVISSTLMTLLVLPALYQIVAARPKAAESLPA
jgi:cobalt-zinc-cadmium resistance protein CzcA